MNLAAIEAFARGAMSALLAGSEAPARASRRRRVRPVRTRSSSPQPTAAPASQMELIEAPGAPADLPAPPFTQAQAEAMEAVLRGDAPTGYYKPDEGVAPWMES